MRPVSCLALLLVALALAAPRVARAQASAISTNIDLSVRAAGMGESGVAVAWGENLDPWANPALLGEAAGVRYENARTRLVPELASDVFLTSQRLTVGAYGIGVLASGKPGGLGSVHLDYGLSGGDPQDSFRAYENVDTWGIGVSFARLARSVVRAGGGRAPGLLRHVDLALGLNHKDVTVQYVPVLAGLPGTGPGTGTAIDRGLLARLTPYDAFARPGGRLFGLERTLRLAVDVAYGTSKLNSGEPPVFFPGMINNDRMMEERHKGWAGHVALEPLGYARLFPARLRGLARSLSPALSVGGTWERITLDYQGFDYTTSTPYPARSHIVNRGTELTLLNVFSWRFGHVSDPDGSVHGASSGWSVGYAFARAVGFRYDHATIPQATDAFTGHRMADVHRRAWSVFLDPLALGDPMRRHTTF